MRKNKYPQTLQKMTDARRKSPQPGKNEKCAKINPREVCKVRYLRKLIHAKIYQREN